MKKLLALLLVVPLLMAFKTGPDDEAIKKEIIANSAKMIEYWNKGELDNYMNLCYPKREDILMQGSNYRIYGYKKIYDMYTKTFPDPAKRGTLSFSDIEVIVLSPESVMMIGKFKLEYPAAKERSSYFTALIRKFPDGWKIVHDHS